MSFLGSSLSSSPAASSTSSPLFTNAYKMKTGTFGNIANQYGGNTTLQNQSVGQRNTESGSLIPGYQSLIDSGGYSPTEKASIEQGTIGGIQGSYNAAADQAQRQMARTGNTAGYGSFLGSLARSKARDVGQGELQVQSQFANEAYQRKLQGLAGLQQLYGVDTSFLNSLGQLQQGLIRGKQQGNAQNSANSPLKTLGQAFGLAGQLAANS